MPFVLLLFFFAHLRFLKASNLMTKEVLFRRRCFCVPGTVCREGVRRRARRAPLSGPGLYPWDVGGDRLCRTWLTIVYNKTYI